MQRRDRYLLAAILILLLFDTLLFASNPWLISYARLSVLKPNRWNIAVAQTQATLETVPDFETHLRSYQTIPSEIDGYLLLLEHIHSALTFINDSRRTLVSMAQIVAPTTTKMAIVAADSQILGPALTSLDNNLGKLLETRTTLVNLGSADAVAVAIQMFRETPSKRTLILLRNACARQSITLRNADRQVQTQLSLLAGAVDQATRIQQGVQHTQDSVAGIPGIADVARKINQTVSDWAGQLQRTHKAFADLHARLEADLTTMRAIQDIVAAAEP